ncbi:ice-binding family protein [Loktanella sp. DJP18]|uniref:ice-binding family protein n=1 Tax=Loktanella sp. DJP18 TaxID=3409788 RepID=UPI003BB4F71F
MLITRDDFFHEKMKTMNNRVRKTAMSTMTAMPILLALPSIGASQELESFAVIAGQSITNTGPTTIIGNIALSPGISYTGSGSVTQIGERFIGDAVAIGIQNDLTTLYTYLASRPVSTGGNLTGKDLGGQTLKAGVYNYDTSAGLSANQTLTFDAEGNPDAIFIINVGSTLTVGSGAKVVLRNGAQGGNIFYRVGSSATLNTSSDLVGQVVALTSITMNTAARLDCGAAFARNGSVTLDTNTIGLCVLEGAGFDDVVDGGTDVEPPVAGRPDVDSPVVGGPVPEIPVGESPTDESPVDGGPVVEAPVDGTPVTDGGEPGPALTGNALDLAIALAEFVAEGGVLPVGIAILPATQGLDELSVSLGQLTGEVSTGIVPIGLQSINTFIDTVMQQTTTTGRGGTIPPLTPGVPAQPIAPKSPQLPVGQVPNRSAEDQLLKYGPAPVLAAPAPIMPEDVPTLAATWDIWASAYGARREIDGDVAIGSHDLTLDTKGLAFGVNVSPDLNTRIGLAFAIDNGSFALADGFGDGSSEGLLVALYGRTAFDKVYVEGALAYGRNEFSTHRRVTIAGEDNFVGEGTSETVAAHVEAGYQMGLITPFVAVRATRLTLPAYAEQTTEGASTYALSYDEQTAKSLRSEIGVEVNLAGRDNAALSLRAAWAHEFADVDPTQTSLQSVPGVSFPVSGAVADRNSLILSSTAVFGETTGFYAGAGINAEYSQNAGAYGGALTVGYRW